MPLIPPVRQLPQTVADSNGAGWVVQPLMHWPMEHLLAVQLQAYAPHLVEAASVLQHKLAAAAPGRPLSWGVARADAPDGLCGYAIACPWHSRQQPRWNHVAATPLPEADCLYVHDIAIAPPYHGQGLAGSLMEQVLQQGRDHGWGQAVLVAVQGAQGYWRRYGFEQAPGPDVSSFGADAVWMVRPL